MKKIYVLLIIMLTSCCISLSNNSSKYLTGIWNHSDDENSFLIIEELDVLHLYISTEFDSDNYVSLDRIYFLKEDFESIKSTDLGNYLTLEYEKGTNYFRFIDPNENFGGEVDPDYIKFNSAQFWVSEGSNLEIHNVKMHVYYRQNSISNEYWEFIYKKGEEEKRDYLYWFFSKDVRKIKENKTILLDSTGKELLFSLDKNQLVEIIGNEQELKKVRFTSGKGTEKVGYLAEESFYEKKDQRKIISTKANIFSAPNEKTSMYLIKGDIVRIIGKEIGYWKMKYTTTKGKVIEGYVKRIDCW